MKACYVMLEFPVLTETFVVDEVAALRERGTEVLTVALDTDAGADVSLIGRRTRQPEVWRAALSLLRHRPAAISALLRGPFTFGYRLKLLWVAELARRRGVGVVHAHFAWRSADAAEVIGRALGTGHSLTAHAYDIFVPQPELPHRLATARIVVTVCEYNRRFLEAEHGPLVAGKLHVVPCSTRADVETTAPPTGGPPTVLTIGRLVPKKGIDTVIRAMARVPDAVLVVVGDGPERGALETLAAGEGVADRVRFVGACDHPATLAWFRRAHVFCLACRVAPDGDRDSMPVVVKEAMAAGRPVVSTREVGVPEMVDDGVSGVLVDPDDPVALGDALAALLADGARAAAMGAAGRETVARRFDLRDQARRLEELLG